MASVTISKKRVAQKISNAKAIDYGILSTMSNAQKYSVLVTETLPFRIKFTNIGIESYRANNPAPIGIAIVGYNNYIL